MDDVVYVSDESDDYQDTVPAEDTVEMVMEVEVEPNATESCTQEKSICPICLDSWTSIGAHRVCALRCGHIFGRSCIERWLNTRLKEKTTCPQCNTRARKTELINLYITHLVAMDDAKYEHIRLKKDYEKEKLARASAESNNYHYNLRVNMLTTEVDMLRKENSNLTQRLRAASDHVIENPSATNTRIFSYTEFKNFKICKQNGCRVMCTHPNNKLIIISKKSENPNLFPGYGICKLNLDNMDCKNFSTEFIRLHKSRIRDMSISPFEPASLLTCSLDKTIRITNLANNALVQEYLCDYPIWSCMWDPETPTRIYAGLANGTVTIFDIRNTTRSAETVVLDYSTTSTRLHGSPVVSLQPISIKVAKNSYISGIATATSEHVFVIEKQDSCFKSHLVSQPSGRVMSMATDATHRRCLISQRPKGFVKNCQQTVGKFSKTISKDNTEAYKFTSEFMIGGGSCSTLLTRSTIYSPMNSDELCVAFGNEDDCSIYLSGLKSASVCKIVSKYGNVVDLSPIWYDQWHYLLGLTESDCTLYKYIV